MRKGHLHAVWKRIRERGQIDAALAASPASQSPRVPSSLTNALRWIHDPKRRRPDLALQRFEELLRTGTAPKDTPETLILLSATCGSGLGDRAFDLVTCALGTPSRFVEVRRLARACLLHMLIDADGDIPPPKLLAYRSAFEPADWAVLLAHGLGGTYGDAYRMQLNKHLATLTNPALAFAVFLAPLRVASSFGKSDPRKTVVRSLDAVEPHRGAVRAVGVPELANYARQFDYGAQLAAYLDGLDESVIDIFALVRHAIGKVSSENRLATRLRDLSPGPSLPHEAYAQRLSNWGLIWRGFRVAKRKGAFDWRNEPSPYWRTMALIARAADQADMESGLRQVLQIDI